MKLLQSIFSLTCFSLAYLSLGCVVPLFGDMPSAREVLDRSEREYKKIKSLHYQSESIVQGFSGQATTPRFRQKIVSVVKLDLDRNFAYLLSDVTYDPPQEQDSDRSETYFLDGTGFTLRANSASNEVLTLWARKDAVHGDKQNTGWQSVFFESEQLLPMGIFRFEEKTASIFDSMRRLSSLKIERQQNTGNESYVVSGESATYRFTITIDPDKNFVMSSYLMESLRKEYPISGIRTFEYHGTDFVHRDGLYFPKQFDLLIVAGNFVPMPAQTEPKYVEYRSTMTSNMTELLINKSLSKEDYGFKTKIVNGPC